jgi:hypothetical protein
MIFKTKGGGIGYIKYYFIANTTAMGLRKGNSTTYGLFTPYK